MPLIKIDLVQVVFNTHRSLIKPRAAEAVHFFFHLAKYGLLNDGRLLISGFGSFTIRNNRRRLVPSDPEAPCLAFRRQIFFQPSPLLQLRLEAIGRTTNSEEA
ncbi:MAG: HU family DNA-binding protein [Desulfobulbus sp.]|nr:HU family DNA-binding protein [Desulfobulbus sp.]